MSHRAIEILDTRILRAGSGRRERTRKIVDTIIRQRRQCGPGAGRANAIRRIDAFDLRWTGAIVARNGEVEETGLGAGVLDDPVESVVWLARRMAGYGQRIEAGQIILSGSFIRPLECPPGTTINADFGRFGAVRLAFD